METTPMTRFFFDYVSDGQVMHDYQGRYYANAQAAREYAELLALDLEHMGEWDGFAVCVRNAHGQEFFSTPVRAMEAA